MPKNRLTDIQGINKYLELLYKHQRNFFSKIRKISHPEQKISLYWLNFSKEVSQVMAGQTKKKYVIIWKQCNNFPEKYLKK